MNTIQFNFHDLILVMTAFLSALLAFVYLIAEKKKHASKPLLVSFLLAHAFIALHELTYYGEQVRYSVLELSPDLFFIGSFAYCVDAVLLYLFTKAIIYRDFSIGRPQAFHLLPIAGYFGYMIAVYYSLDYGSKALLIRDWLLTESWHYVSVELLIKLSRIAYAILCLRLISQYRDQQKESHADISTMDLNWLKVLVVGFLCVMAGDALLALVKVVNLGAPIEISLLSSLGVSIYYATFILLLALLTYTIAKLSLVEQIQQGNNSSPTVEEGSAFKPEDYVARIEAHMRHEKPYLNSEITIDMLARELEVSPKALSVTLNHHFQMNFYEFINRYRIDDAKKLLAQDKEKTITDIFYKVGFNSKSVFYTFFRKCEGVTPSAYRKKFTDNS